MFGGIDEAGRGPVLGPLVVAGVAVADDGALRALGVKDSKRLPPERRGFMVRRMVSMGVRHEVVVVDAEELDERLATKNLNKVEVELFAEVGRRLAVPALFVDAADVDAGRFGTRIAAATGAKVTSEHRADDRHPVVAAASLFAKVRRDEEMAKLARRLERRSPFPVGSGYPSDPDTRRFLAEYVKEHGALPEGARKRWKTSKELLRPQSTLHDHAANER